MVVTVNLTGGLGNQLFEIFTTISYSIDSNHTFIFSNIKQTGNKRKYIRSTYFNSFLSGLEKYLVNPDFINSSFSSINEKNFKYNKLQIIDLNQKIILYGYFQSYLYFDKNFSYICKLLQIYEKQNLVKTKVLADLQIDFNITISMHFRLGDYKKKQEHHNILPKKYYLNSLNFIINQINLLNSQSQNDLSNSYFNILYFCEDEDIDIVDSIITDIKTDINIKTDGLVFMRADSKLSDWEQLLLMSLCEHNIIANSTFSWWSGYFNTNQNKIICYPSQWFGPNIVHCTSDLFPKNWFKIIIE